MCFNTDCKCLKIPFQPGRPIPSRAKLRPYDVVEQDGMVWIWMGDEPNPTLRPPRIPELVSDGGETRRLPNVDTPTNYMLLSENVPDITPC